MHVSELTLECVTLSVVAANASTHNSDIYFAQEIQQMANIQ